MEALAPLPRPLSRDLSPTRKHPSLPSAPGVGSTARTKRSRCVSPHGSAALALDELDSITLLHQVFFLEVSPGDGTPRPGAQMSSSQRQSRQEITQSSSSSSPPPAPRSHSTTSPASSPRPSQKSPPRQQQQQQRQEGARGEESVGAATQSPTAATTSGRARDRSSISTRGVYWSDETNPSQFTFYREGTPTPPEYAGDEEKNAGGEGRPTAASAAAAALATARSIEPKEPRPPKKTICGMKRWPFWLLVAFVLVAIGVGVGVGVGIGVVRHRSRMSGTGSRYALQPRLIFSRSPH